MMVMMKAVMWVGMWAEKLVESLAVTKAFQQVVPTAVKLEWMKNGTWEERMVAMLERRLVAMMVETWD